MVWTPRGLRKSSSPKIPILATIPRSGTWFLRYSLSFFAHLTAGGRVEDRLTGETVGASLGAPFEFERFQGGPLFAVRPALPAEYLFVGHTVCPGFARIASEVPWWSATSFHTPGFDYLHDGLDYDWTPVDLAKDRYTRISPHRLDDTPWSDETHRMVLVYRDPLDQLDSFYHYSRTHAQERYRAFNGRSLGEVTFQEFVFGGALASYAKQFMSYQEMAVRLPEQVRLVPYEHLMARPVEVLAGMLEFLTKEAGIDLAVLASAISLSRPEHLRAIERELGRSLDGTHAVNHGHMRPASARSAPDEMHKLRRAAMDALWSLGLDRRYFSGRPTPRDAPAPERARMTLGIAAL